MLVSDVLSDELTVAPNSIELHRFSDVAMAIHIILLRIDVLT